jgi:predicted nucleic acid-binding protein
MNGDKLLDTNILIYLSQGKLKLSDFTSSEETLSISVITYMEALGYHFERLEEEELMNALCNHLRLMHLSPEIIAKVIEIRKTSKIKLPDAIIAATAMNSNLILVTRNTKDFGAIKNTIKLLDPFR